jgi:hypothetical protein
VQDMQLADLNNSNWKPVDWLDRLTNRQPKLHAYRVRPVSLSCHSKAGRSHSEEEAMNLCAAQPNHHAWRWWSLRTGGGEMA